MNRGVGGAGNSSLTVKNAVIRYNRRNNPELEKRRIHHCDFLGKFKQKTNEKKKLNETKRNKTTN